jgi:hypothetical protein
MKQILVPRYVELSCEELTHENRSKVSILEKMLVLNRTKRRAVCNCRDKLHFSPTQSCASKAERKIFVEIPG